MRRLKESSFSHGFYFLFIFRRETRLEIGDFVNIQANKLSNKWVVDNKGGFVIEKPDYLVSGTSVVGALFCTRRGVLSDRFKGIDSVTDCKQGANLMVIGSLVHELLQEVFSPFAVTRENSVFTE